MISGSASRAPPIGIICHLPEPSVIAGRCDKAQAEAESPSLIDVMNERRLNVGAAHAREVVAIGVEVSDWTVRQQRQIESGQQDPADDRSKA